jgi:AraC-like DNA-binding protein
LHIATFILQKQDGKWFDMFCSPPGTVVLEVPPWPHYLISSYRRFMPDEKHITRVCADYVLVFIFERSLCFTEAGTDIEVAKGEWYMQVPGLKQEGRKGSPAPEYYYIHFRASGRPLEENATAIPEVFPENRLAGIDERSGSKQIILPTRGKFSLQKFTPLFDRLERLKQDRITPFIEQEATFLAILGELQSASSAFPETKMKELASQAMEFLWTNYNKPFVCSDLSLELNYSTDYITRIMRRLYGITPLQYVHKIRVEHACELLGDTDYTLDVIARNLGYGDVSLFYKSFHKQMGMSPGAWRVKSRRLQE